MSNSHSVFFIEQFIKKQTNKKVELSTVDNAVTLCCLLPPKLLGLNVEQDLMIQNIVDGCAGLLYLNLSCTLITDVTIRELSR